MDTFTFDVERPKKRPRIDSSAHNLAETKARSKLTTLPGSQREVSTEEDHHSEEKSRQPVHTCEKGERFQESASQREDRFRELYVEPPDFKDLARRDEELRPLVKGRELDFKDPAAVMQLTKTLLKLDFGLELEMPGDRLCPPLTDQVANRHNYILWLKELLDSTDESVYEEEDFDKVYEKKVKGLDIGTGASCIYPLLGCAQRPNWHFSATDIDSKSLEYAQKNITLNKLSSRIILLPRSPNDSLIPPSTLPLDFTMTNPPFYISPDHLATSATKKSLPPLTACTGAPNEMVTEGGEVGFINRIIDESLRLRGQVRWYTAMVGFLSSLSEVVERLKKEGIENYVVGEFVQGKRTRRWVVGWSFGGMRPSANVGSIGKGGDAGFAKTLLPPPTEVDIVRFPTMKDTDGFMEAFRKKMEGLELKSWRWSHREGVGRTDGRVWGRAWRRLRKQVEEGRISEEDMRKRVTEEVFGFKVQIRVVENEAVIWVRWLEGREHSAFESFTGFVKASAEAARVSPI